MNAAQHTLKHAAQLIGGDRNETHGHYPLEARRIGTVWAALLNLPDPIPPRTVAAMMVGLKMVRATAGRVNLDDWTDGAAYAALGALIDEERP